MRDLLVGAALVCALAAPAAAQQGPEGRLDPAVARCILDRLYQVETRAAAELLYEACVSLVRQEGPNGGGGGVMVHCRVPGDPDWMEPRLLTRSQCAAARGIAAAP